MRRKLKSVIEKYRKSPEFLTVNLLDVNQPGNAGNTLLHLAARDEALDDIGVLVKSGAEVNARGEFGDTALHQVSIHGRTKSARKLLRLGADATIRNDFGETALDLAELMGRNEVVKILKAHSAGATNLGAPFARSASGNEFGVHSK